MTMRSFVLNIPDFEPDKTQGPTVTSMLDVLPDVQGWKTGKSFVTSATTTTSIFKGGIVIPYSGVDYVFCGLGSKLYRGNVGFALSEKTRASGGDYTVYWRWDFDVFGDNLYAACGNDKLQYVAATSTSNFADVTGLGSTNWQFVKAVGGFLFVAKDLTVRWSSLEDATSFTAGEGGSDQQDMPNGGPIMGLVGYENALIIGQRDKIRVAQFNPSNPYVFSFAVAQENIGVRIAYSMVGFNNTFAYIGNDGFYMGLEGRRIGKGRVDRWFFENVETDSYDFIYGVHDNATNSVVWVFQLNGAAAHSDGRYGLAYDYVLDKWSLRFAPTSGGVNVYGLASEAMDQEAKGRETALHGFSVSGTTYTLGAFTGTPTTCQVKISDARTPAPGKSYIQYVKYLDDLDYSDGETITIDAQEYSGQVASGGSATTSTGTLNTAQRGKAFVRAWGEKFDITLNADTGDFKNIEIGYRQAGNR